VLGDLSSKSLFQLLDGETTTRMKVRLQHIITLGTDTAISGFIFGSKCHLLVGGSTCISNSSSRRAVGKFFIAWKGSNVNVI